MSLSNAERQKRWRDKLRAAAAAAPSGDQARADPDRDTELRIIRQLLETVGRERNAATKRCHQLEAELREAQKRGRQLEMELLKAQNQRPSERVHAPHSVEISPRMYRLVRSLLHPDRVVDPAVKEYLHEAFVRFTDQVEKAGRDNLSSMEETMRRRAKTAA